MPHTFTYIHTCSYIWCICFIVFICRRWVCDANCTCGQGIWKWGRGEADWWKTKFQAEFSKKKMKDIQSSTLLVLLHIFNPSWREKKHGWKNQMRNVTFITWREDCPYVHIIGALIPQKTKVWYIRLYLDRRLWGVYSCGGRLPNQILKFYNVTSYTNDFKRAMVYSKRRYA